MDQITIAYWMGSKLKGLDYEHNDQLSYSDELRDQIIDDALTKGYSVMIRPSKDDSITMLIDNGRFSQR